MLLDKLCLFSDAQSIASTAGTLVSDKSYDTGAAATIPGLGGTVINDIGRGRAVNLLCQVVTTVTSGGSATVVAQLVQSDSADLSTPTVLDETAAIPVASLVAGYQFRLGFPAGITKRYIGMQYVIGTATTTAGAVTSGISWDRQTSQSIG